MCLVAQGVTVIPTASGALALMVNTTSKALEARTLEKSSGTFSQPTRLDFFIGYASRPSFVNLANGHHLVTSTFVDNVGDHNDASARVFELDDEGQVVHHATLTPAVQPGVDTRVFQSGGFNWVAAPAVDATSSLIWRIGAQPDLSTVVPPSMTIPGNVGVVLSVQASGQDLGIVTLVLGASESSGLFFTRAQGCVP